jgi:RNase P/RNase MRP subunit p29
VGGSLVLTFVVAELILRQVVPTTTHDALTVPSADPELQFELQRGADLEFDGLTIRIRPPTCASRRWARAAPSNT